MATTLKFLNLFYYTWLAGGVFLQVNAPEILKVVNPDKINGLFYHIVLGITFFLWVIKYSLPLYEKYRDIKNKKYDDKDKK